MPAGAIMRRDRWGAVVVGAAGAAKGARRRHRIYHRAALATIVAVLVVWGVVGLRVGPTTRYRWGKVDVVAAASFSARHRPTAGGQTPAGAHCRAAVTKALAVRRAVDAVGAGVCCCSTCKAAAFRCVAQRGD